jgi:CRP-like cAMP-binding protein
VTAPDPVRLEREIMLRSAFPTMPTTAHARFVEVLEQVDVETGQVLYSRGEPAERIYFLTQGRVALELGDEKPWFFEPVTILGVIDATLERPRRRTCRALEPSKLLAMLSSEWFDLLEDNARIAREAIRNFATGLHLRWRKLAARVPWKSEPRTGPTPATLEYYERLLGLRRAAFVNRAGMQALVSLATVAQPVFLREGELLFGLGESQDSFHVVASGNVELAQGDDFRVQHAAGELVGGPAALCNALSSYSARAQTDAAILRISEQDFYDTAEEHPRLTRGALVYLVSEIEAVLPFDAPDETGKRVAPEPNHERG